MTNLWYIKLFHDVKNFLIVGLYQKEPQRVKQGLFCCGTLGVKEICLKKYLSWSDLVLKNFVLKTLFPSLGLFFETFAEFFPQVLLLI